MGKIRKELWAKNRNLNTHLVTGTLLLEEHYDKNDAKIEFQDLWKCQLSIVSFGLFYVIIVSMGKEQRSKYKLETLDCNNK